MSQLFFFFFFVSNHTHTHTHTPRAPSRRFDDQRRCLKTFVGGAATSVVRKAPYAWWFDRERHFLNAHSRAISLCCHSPHDTSRHHTGSRGASVGSRARGMLGPEVVVSSRRLCGWRVLLVAGDDALVAIGNPSMLALGRRRSVVSRFAVDSFGNVIFSPFRLFVCYSCEDLPQSAYYILIPPSHAYTSPSSASPPPSLCGRSTRHRRPVRRQKTSGSFSLRAASSTLRSTTASCLRVFFFLFVCFFFLGFDLFCRVSWMC